MTLDELIREVKGRHPDGSSLDHVADACAVAAQMDEMSDHLVGHFVDQARRGGASWTMIGERMGVTKQAAQKRFVPGEVSMERFTNRATVVILKAQNEAGDRGADEVTSLHLVLGLLAEWEGLAGQAIAAAGVSKSDLARAVAEMLPPRRTPKTRHVPFSAGLKKVRELVIREGLRLGHNYIGTEHLLLGLLEASDEPGAALLIRLGVTKSGVESWTLQALEELKRSFS